MSVNLGVMSAAVTLDDKNYRNTLAGLESTSQSSFKKIAAYAAGYLSFRAIGQFATNAYQAFTVQEEAVDALNDALRKSGENVDFWGSKLQDTASKLQQVTTFGDEATLQAMATAMNIGVAAKDMERATKAAMGLAAAYKIDLQSAMQLIGRASQGQTAMLTRYGIVLDTTKSKQEQFAELLQKGVDFFPLAAADTATKKIIQMKNAIGDTMELIGGQLAEALLPVVNNVKLLAEAYNNLSPATRALTNETLLLASALILLGKAKVFSAIGKGTKLVADGLVALKTIGFAGVATAAKGAIAAFGATAAALLALGAAYLYARKKDAEYQAELQDNQKNADARVASANQLADAHQKEANANTEAMKRLQELAKQERLSNAEKDESEKLIKQITGVHKDLDIALDKTTGKLKIGASAWANMNAEQQKTARKDTLNKLNALEARNSSMINSLQKSTDFGILRKIPAVVSSSFASRSKKEWEDNTRSKISQWVEDTRQLNTIEKQIEGFQKIANALRNKGDDKDAKKADEIVAALKQQLAIKKQLEAMNNGKVVKDAKAEAEALKKSAKESEKIRKTIEALQNKEFSIKFNASDVDKKLEMLKSEMNKIFNEKVSGKYKSIDEFIGADRTNMTKEELKTVEKLVELRAEQARIEKDIGDSIKNERKEFENLIAKNAKNAAIRAFDKRISTMTKEGDREGAISLVQSELEKARAASEKLQKQYKAEMDLLDADKSKQTDAEKKRRAELKRQMEEAMSTEIRLTGKLDNLKTSENQTRQAVGAWTLEALSAQLGAPSKPEQQTAKNTKKTVEILEKVSEQLNTNGSTKYDA